MSVAAPALLSGCSGGHSVDRRLEFSTFKEAMAEATRLASRNLLLPPDVFSLSQIFVHCAQSIEYSMQGFPEMKPALFRKTLGAAAFGVFSSRGTMSHDLTEGIPGAPALDASADVDDAIKRLEHSVVAFSSSNGDFKPHFAYGSLNKKEYESAHIMHLANHFSSIDA